MSFRRCWRPAGSRRLPVLSGSQQYEGHGSTRQQFLGRSYVGRWCLMSGCGGSESRDSGVRYGSTGMLNRPYTILNIMLSLTRSLLFCRESQPRFINHRLCDCSHLLQILPPFAGPYRSYDCLIR